jgi:hypothetical protein
MRGRLGRIVKGKLVLQAPHEDAESQCEERDHAHATKGPICAPKMHSYPNLISLLQTLDALQTAAAREPHCSLIAHPREKVAQLFSIFHKNNWQVHDA